jgi:hydrogenase expression/formation protein HypD
MKYIDEFRNGDTAQKLAHRIAEDAHPDRVYRLMEFCGGHTHAIFRYGIPDLLPPNVRMIHGPGCPVCVLPIGRLDMAIRLVREQGVTLCTYGDMLRVPGSRKMSLLRAKAEGGDVRMVYSATDALEVARRNPDKQVVFFAIGFETTTPPTAVAVKIAEAEGLANFSVYCNHVLTPPALIHLLETANPEDPEPVRIDGFVGPAHVSVVIGTDAYAKFAEHYRKPVVISGFEPLDVLQSIWMLVRQLNDDRTEIENQYTRAVQHQGNLKAQRIVGEVLEVRESFEWRGLGDVPYSALRVREAYARFDAERRFGVEVVRANENKACECPAILRGAKKPTDCKVFGSVCTPENPLGSCMVSAEGACAAYYTYGRYKDRKTEAA